VDKGKGKAVDVPKKVTFATPDGPGSGTATPTMKPDDPTAERIPDSPVDGIIGQLELYRSGAIKMRLNNGILLDVSLLRFTAYDWWSDPQFIPPPSGIGCNATFFPPASHPHRQTEEETLRIGRSQQAVYRHPRHRRSSRGSFS